MVGVLVRQEHRAETPHPECAERRHDPYAFPPQPATDDLYLFNQGSNYQAYRLLGAHPQTRQGISGVRFRVWAPNAERASVVGEFNRWDGRVHQMATLGASGVWELFIPGLAVALSLVGFNLRLAGRDDQGRFSRVADDSPGAFAL